MKSTQNNPNRLLNNTYWVLLVGMFANSATFLPPFEPMRIFISAGFAALVVGLSIAGLINPRTRTAWFIPALLLAALTLLFGFSHSHFPIQS